MKYLTLIAICLFVMVGNVMATEYNFTYEAPVKNEDGSPLTDLEGYSLYEDGLIVKDCLDSLSCTYDVPEGSHTYTIRAYDKSDGESKDSNPVVLDITICPEPPTNLKAERVE